MSTNEAETRALQMGWQPKEKFRGDPEKWVPAETFVERGETFVPYLKANNRKLEAKLSEQAEILRQTQEQIAALREYNTEYNKEKVTQQRKDLVAGIKKARDEGDVETEESLRERLADTKAALAESDKAKPEVVKPNLPVTAEVRAAFETFQANHIWYDEDHMMKSAFIGMMQTKMLDPAFAKLSIEDRFETVAQEVEGRFGLSPRGGASKSKYEGGSGGGGPDSRTSKEKGFAELPQESKDACERYGAKLVGKGKTFKTQEEWQAKFAQDYWRNNPNG
jgi:hypothetical protein